MFTAEEVVIFGTCDFGVNGVVVGTVVGHVQFAVAVNEGQVTVAIESADTSCTKGDEVAVMDIIDGGCGIAEDGVDVG